MTFCCWQAATPTMFQLEQRQLLSQLPWISPLAQHGVQMLPGLPSQQSSVCRAWESGHLDTPEICQLLSHCPAAKSPALNPDPFSCARLAECFSLPLPLSLVLPRHSVQLYAQRNVNASQVRQEAAQHLAKSSCDVAAVDRMEFTLACLKVLAILLLLETPRLLLQSAADSKYSAYSLQIVPLVLGLAARFNTCHSGNAPAMSL